MTYAVWGEDYDYITDTIFECPTCSQCEEPSVVSDGEGQYFCCYCGDQVELTAEMKKWFEERSGRKEETDVCMNCGKHTFTRILTKNRVTKEYRTAYGSCSNCGMKLIV